MTTPTQLTTAPCDKHELTGCADCMDLAKVRRATGTNEVAFAGDCAVTSYQEITGATYDEAVEALRAVGFIPGQGTPHMGITKALTAAGYTVTSVPVRGRGYDVLPWESAQYGKTFLVSGQKGRTGHSWTIMDGKINRGYRPPFRYLVFRVTA